MSNWTKIYRNIHTTIDGIIDWCDHYIPLYDHSLGRPETLNRHFIIEGHRVYVHIYIDTGDRKRPGGRNHSLLGITATRYGETPVNVVMKGKSGDEATALLDWLDRQFRVAFGLPAPHEAKRIRRGKAGRPPDTYYDDAFRRIQGGEAAIDVENDYIRIWYERKGIAPDPHQEPLQRDAFRQAMRDRRKRL